jgi:hypothetical protein
LVGDRRAAIRLQNLAAAAQWHLACAQLAVDPHQRGKIMTRRLKSFVCESCRPYGWPVRDVRLRQPFGGVGDSLPHR